MTCEAVKKTPGKILKHARQSLGLSLGDVAAMTRIPRTMLSHLEADRFDEYSAPVFVRGHIRSYARELKLDPERIIQAFERHTGTFTPSEDEAPEPKAAARKSISKARKQVAGWRSHVSGVTGQVRAAHLVAVALVLVGLFFVVNLISGSKATAKDPAQFPTASEEEWEVEQAAEETRWALEQPAEADSNDSAAAKVD